MSQRTRESRKSFFQKLVEELGDVWQLFWLNVRRGMAGLRNRLRRARRMQVDYIVIPVGGPLPERTAPPRNFIQRQLPLPPEPLTLQVLNARLRAIADAGNVKGVILVLQGLSAGLATLQNLRQSLLRLREAGKETIVYTPYVDVPHYYVATAADRIVIPPGSHFEVLGLRSDAVFLKDALAQLGVQVEVVQISPYKASGNMFSRSDVTPEQQEQMEWLLDESYDMLTAAMASGRGQEQAEIKALIDRAPLTAEEAVAAGLVDLVAYEDELAALLAPAGPARPADDDAANTGQKPKRRARLVTWNEGRAMLLEKVRRRPGRYVGVVSLEGIITMGTSRQPPVDLPVPLLSGPTAGEETLTRLLRRAERNSRVAALVFHVDSRGGSALASDLIWRQVQRIARRKPVVVYMGNVAASGGYYVSSAANHIMAQSGTITGSIGVLSGHVSTAGLYEKIQINRVALKRGERAGLYSDEEPLDEERRQVLWDNIVHIYERFKQVVADGRDLPLAELDPICEGRVWTGRQAAARGLVDSHGDFINAIQLAADMAGLPAGAENDLVGVNIHAKQRGGYLLPRPFPDPAEIASFLTGRHLAALLRQPLLLLPFEIKWWP
jgi:protease IV